MFNTGSFLGQRHATITVTFDRPQYAEVQLDIRGYVRRDVIVDPSLIQFGAVQQGAGAERQVKVTYAGRSDWKITDVRSRSPWLEAELDEVRRTAGQVSYEDGTPVTNTNSAFALASCRGCTTVAVSFQVVLIVGQSNVITPAVISEMRTKRHRPFAVLCKNKPNGRLMTMYCFDARNNPNSQLM